MVNRWFLPFAAAGDLSSHGRVIAVTPFALDGNPAEWAHTSWLKLSDTGQIEDILVTWPDVVR